jgi:hypothetical protein
VFLPTFETKNPKSPNSRQALEKIPPLEAKAVFMMYAKLEEEHGLMKNAMAIYDRAAKTIDINDRCIEPKP